MEQLSGLTAYDMVVLGLLALLIGRGIWLGMLKQVTGLSALYLGYYVASQYHSDILPFLENISENPKVIFLASYVVLFVVTYIVVMLLGKLLSYVINMTITSWFDRLLGGVIGFAKGIIVVVLTHIVLGTILAPENTMLRSCATCDILNSCADLTRGLIKDEDVRKSLMQKEPAITIDAVKDYITKDKESSSESTTKW